MATAARKRAPTQTELSKALTDPLRSEVLTVLSKRTASPKEIAEELAAELTSVSYHVRYLVDLNCAELVKAERVRGRTKRTYRATVRNFASDETVQVMHPAVADSHAGQVWKELSADMKLAAESGSLETKGPLELNCLELNVDEEGYLKVLEILKLAREEVERAEAESGERVAKGKGAAGPISVTLLGFRLPSSPG